MIKLNPDFIYDESLDDFILTMYESGASNIKIAVSLGLTHTQFTALRSSNIEFNTLCEFGENLSQAILEDMALRGAQGQIKNFNNTVLQFLLKSLYPHTYNDKKEGKDEGDTLLEQLTAGSLKLVRHNE